MASLSQILADPNYVNANAATKAAIFDKYAPLDPNFANANAATQTAIRSKFGIGGLEKPAETQVKVDAAGTVIQPDVPLVGGQMRAQQDERQNVGAELPAFAKTNPRLYANLVQARQLAGPTIEMLGGAFGGAAGGAAGVVASPSVVVNPVTGAVAGSALGYATAKELLNKADVALGLAPQETGTQAMKRSAGNIAEGAAFEVAGGVAGKVVNKLVDAGTAVMGKIADINQLPKQLAAKIARKSFETPANVAAGRNALQEAIKAGDDVTAQQALAQGKVVAPGAQAVIQKTISKTSPAVQSAKELADETARMSTIKQITPDLDSAVKVRKVASKPLYEAADKAIVPIDDDVAAVLARMPEGTLAAAANIAKMEGRPFIMGKTTTPVMQPTGVLDAAGNPVMREIPGNTAELTGESMHYIRRALSDIAYGSPAAGVGRDTQIAARGLLDDYLKVFESKVPEYGQARAIYSDLSAPVNQAQVLKEMASVLEKPGGGERVGPFLNVLGRGETAMLKRAGGKGAPRYEALSEVLTPDQLKAVRTVADQLSAEASIGKQISAGQELATKLLKDELPNYRLPNIFNVIATTANKVLDTLGVKVGEKTIKELAKAGETAKSFDELLGLLPGEDRIKVLKAISDPDTWAKINKVAKSPAVAKGLMGVTAETPEMPANALAPIQQNQNALTR
jgi:hypothetical protein